MLLPTSSSTPKALAGLVAAAVLFLILVPGPGQDTRPCRVLRITDGDTFVCDGGERVRMLSIDTPEMQDEPWGDRARDHLLTVLEVGMEVQLEVDVEPVDRYGRTLAWVHLPDGRIANEVMARDGYAQTLVIPPNVRFADVIRRAVESARAENLGLWSDGGL